MKVIGFVDSDHMLSLIKVYRAQSYVYTNWDSVEKGRCHILLCLCHGWQRPYEGNLLVLDYS